MFRPFANQGVTTPLASAGVEINAIAQMTAQVIESNRNNNILWQYLYTVMSPSSYANANFQKLCTTIMDFTNAALSSQGGNNMQQVIEQSIMTCCSFAAADHISRNNVARQQLNMAEQQEVQNLLNQMPQITQFITQYKSQMGGGSTMMPNTGFNGHAQSSFPQNAFSPFAGQSQSGPRTPQSFANAKPVGMPTVDLFATNTTAHSNAAPAVGPITRFTSRAADGEAKVEFTRPQQPAPQRVPGSNNNEIKANSRISALELVVGDEMDYNDHRLVYPGADVTGSKVAGTQVDYFGILSKSVVVEAKDTNPDNDLLDVHPLAEESVVMYPDSGENVIAFGDEHAIALMHANLITAKGLRMDNHSFLLCYDNLEVLAMYPSAEDMGIAWSNCAVQNILNVESPDIYGLQATIKETFENPVSPLNALVSRKLNMLATRLCNETILMDLNIEAAGLNAMDSFGADFHDVVDHLVNNSGADWDNYMRDLLIEPTGFAGRISKMSKRIYRGEDENAGSELRHWLRLGEEVPATCIYFAKARILWGIPRSSFDLGISAKPGVNFVTEAAHPTLYAAIRRNLDHVSDKLSECTELVLQTVDGARYRVLYNSLRTKLALVPIA